MRIRCLALLLVVPAFSGAAEISVGGVALSIPNPATYSPVTPEMSLLYEVQKQFVAPMNEEFVAFIPAHDVAEVLKGNIPELPRRFSVQVARNLITPSVTSADFEQIKSVIATANEDIIKSVEQDLPGIVEQMNKNIMDKFDVDVAFSVPQMVPMPAHENTDRTLAYSAFVRYSMNDDSGEPVSSVSVVTATLAHVKGKVLFLYSFAGESDLEWSRDASRQWSNAVVAANPSDLKSAAKEALPSAITAIDWRQVGISGIVGAFIGLISLLIGKARSRAKKD